MQQFSIKNDEAVNLLNDLTKRTGKGKTEVVIEALKQYQQSQGRSSTQKTIDFFEREVHPFVKQEYLGKVPTKEDIEDELGMP